MRGVLFDATGTLIQLREPVGTTYSRMARDFGVVLPAARLNEAFGRVLGRAPPMVFPGESSDRAIELERRWWRELVRATFRAADSTLRPGDFRGGFDACFDALFRHFAGGRAWAAAPAAAEALAALRDRGRATGIVSNFDHRLHGILEEVGLTPLLDVVIRPSDAGAAKPDRRIFAVALEHLGIPPSAAVYVGDDDARDLAGARSAGLHAIDIASLATLADLPGQIDALDDREQEAAG